MAYAKTCKNGAMTTKGFQEAVEGMSLSTKLGAAAFKALAVAGNMLAMMAVAKVIELAATGIDNWIHRVERANEAMGDAFSEYQSAKSNLENINSELASHSQRIDELQAKGPLTIVEEGELARLQDITKELLLQQDIAERKAAAASREAAEKAVNAYQTQFGRYNISEENLEQSLNETPLWNNEKDNIIDNLVTYINAKELYNEAYQQYEEALRQGQDTDAAWYKQDAEGYAEDVEDYSNLLEASINDLMEKRLAMEDEYRRIVEKQENGVEILSSSDQDILNSYKKIYDSMKLIYEYLDQDAWNDMEISDIFHSEGIEKTKQELVALYQAGKLTPEALEAFPKLSEAIRESEILAETEAGKFEAFYKGIAALAEQQAAATHAAASALTPSQVIDRLNDRLKPAFDALKTAYQSIFSEDGFDPGALDIPMLEAVMSSLEELNRLEGADIHIDTAAVDRLSTVLADADVTKEQAGQAFNDFASTLLHASGATEGMTQGTRDLTEQLLETMGVTNAAAVADYALAQAKARALLSSHDLTQKEEGLYAALLEEGMAAGLTRQQIYRLTAAEIALGHNSLTSEQKIQNLKELAEAYGDTAAAALAASLTDRLAGGEIDAQTALKDLLSQMGASLQEVEFGFPNVKEAASQAGAEAGDAYLEAFEEELGELERLRDSHTLTEKEYLEGLRVLYQDYFRDKKKYLKEYEKYELQYLQGMKTLYESAISAASSLLDQQISSYEEQKEAAVSALEEERDAAVSALEAQKEQLEDQKELLEEQVKSREETIAGIRDEIDAIKEANEARKREISLQKAKYDLERMQSQHTVLSYSKEKGMHYVQDLSGLQDARQKLEDARLEQTVAGKEEDIRLVEEDIRQLEKQGEALEQQTSLLEEQMEQTRASYENLIREAEKYWDGLIRSLEEYKARWEELGKVEEQAKILSALEQLGISPDQVLNLSEEAFSQLKGEYLAILTDLYDGNALLLSCVSQAAGTAREDLGSCTDSAREYADALSGVGEALAAVNQWSLDSDTQGGVLRQFTGLKNAVGETSCALAGPGAGNGSGENGSSQGSFQSQTGSPSGGSGSLTGALSQMRDTAGAVIGEPEAQGDGTAIGSFGSLKTAVNLTAQAVGGESSGKHKNLRDSAAESSLSGSVVSLGETTQETLGEPGGEGTIGSFENLDEAVSGARDQVVNVQKAMEDLNGMTADCTITVHIETTGGLPGIASETAIGAAVGAMGPETKEHSPDPGKSKPIKGRALASGSWPVQSTQRRALVGEEGYEIIVRDGRFFTVGNDGPEMFPVKKGDIVFSHEQSVQLLEKGHLSGRGRAYADGAVGGFKILTPEGKVVPPISPRSLYEHGTQMRELVRQIDHGSIVNQKNIRPSVHVDSINITCPGVTSREVMKEVGIALNRQFSGFHNFVDQQIRIG